MDRFTAALARLLRRSAQLLPAGRREWAEAVLAEAGRVAWLCGGLWLVAREVVMGRLIRGLAFAAAAVGLVWIGWPGASSNSATPLNRVQVTGIVVLLAVLPWVVRRYCGPVRSGWAPRAARVGGYVLALALIAAKAVKDRYGSKLGTYFVIVPEFWVLEIVLLLVIVGYVAGLFILTSERIRLTRWALPAGVGLGGVTAVLYLLASFGVNLDHDGSPPRWWWGMAALALPLATGLLAGRLTARNTRQGALNPVRQGCLAACCAAATTAMLVAVFTMVMIALFPHQVPLQGSPAAGGGGYGYIAGGGCETCVPVNTVIPRGLRHEYLAEISVGQAGNGAFAVLLIAPFVGAGLGALGGGFALGSPGTGGRRGGGPIAASPPALSQPSGRLRASDADREKVIDALKAAFGQGRLAKDEFDTRVGHAFTARTYADLAALTADIPPG